MIFILNKQEKVVNILKNGGESLNSLPFFDDLLTEDLATGSETYKFSTISNPTIGENLIVGNYVAFKKGESYKLFQIIGTEERHDDILTIDVYCECAGLELLNSVFRKKKLNSATLRAFLDEVLMDTGWNVGFVEYTIQDTLELELDTASVYSILQNNVGKFGGEIEFRVKINNGRISQKFVDVYGRRGRVTGKRFEFGKNIKNLIRNVDSSDLFTALIGKGKNDISFKDVVVDGISKPLGQDFVADEEAFKNYNHNGYHIMGLYEIDTEDPKELLKLTYKKLQEVKNPKINYEVDVELLGNDVSIGDTVGIIDHFFNPPILLMARVSKLETSFTNPDGNKCTLSNFIEVKSNISKELLEQLQGYVNNSISDKFPIKNEDIADNAITAEKISEYSITTNHLKADSITADKIKSDSIETRHLQANSITSDKIVANSIEAEHIAAGQITADKIATGTITAESGIIADAAIGTAQIKDGEITVAKIENAFVDKLVAKEGKFESAHIGELTSNNIATGVITADKIATGTITAESGVIGNAAIGTAQIKDGEITVAKIENAFVDKLVAKEGKFESAHIGELTSNNIAARAITADKIATGTITAESGVIGNAAIGTAQIKDGEITVAKIENAFVDKLVAKEGKFESAHIGKLTSNNISTETINTIALGASEITANKIAAGEIKVGNANIVDGSIMGAKIKHGEITNAHIENATIESGKIKEIQANKIKSGTLDCNNIEVKNLKAESITTGSLVVQGENLIPNSTMRKKVIDEATDSVVVDYWSVNSSYKFINELNDGCEVVKFDGANLVSGNYYMVGCNNLKGDKTGYAAKKGDNFVVSAYFKIPKEHNISGWFPAVGVWYYGLENGNLIIKKSQTTNINMELIDQWQRITVTLEAPEDTLFVKPVIVAKGSGTFYCTQVMLSRGQLSSVWKPHTDELISDGAIGNEHLGDEIVTANKLNLKEIFAEEAFIEKLQSTTINASQLEVDIIRNDLINFQGLIGFEALDEEISEKFIFDTSSDKTYINGGKIYTNSVTADKIDIKGLTVLDKTNKPTFTIDSTGEVKITGNIESSNWSESENTGYQISKSGNATFNEAIIRGKVILPNAGIDNGGLSQESVRFWAGSDYEGRESAPFKVLQDGTVHAIKGMFNGTFTGKLSVGNIHIEDTNDTDGAFEIKDKNDVNTKVKFSMEENFIDGPFILGNLKDKRFEFNKSSGELNLYKTNLRVEGTTSYIELSKTSTGLNIGNLKTGTLHTIQHSTSENYEDSLLFYARGNAANLGGDFRFAANDRNVRVRVQGDLEVDNKIKSKNNNVEMRMSNGGIYFYAI